MLNEKQLRKQIQSERAKHRKQNAKWGKTEKKVGE